MKLVKSIFNVIVEGVLISKRGMSTSKLTSQLNSLNTKKKKFDPNYDTQCKLIYKFKAHLTFQLLLDP
jgi:hypothetical protein